MTQPRKQKPYRRFLPLAAMLVLLVSLAACFPSQPPNPSPSVPPPVTPATPAPTTSSGKVQLYWLKEGENSVSLAPTPLTTTPPNATSASAKLEAGLQRLMTGPVNTDVSTSIPTGTKLNSFTVKPDGIHVDLSREFMGGGGSASMQGRLGQVIYTATSLDPNAKVWISVAGEPLRVLGGEGLDVPHPITRKQFDSEFKL
jgi:spore germination protein GerM